MRHLFFPLLLLSMFILHPVAAAESAAKPPEPDEASAAEPTFNLHFSGGSFPDLVREIAEQSGRPPNVVIGEGARELEVPPFELYSVTVDNVFNPLYRVLSWSLESTDRELVADMAPGGVWAFGVRTRSHRVRQAPEQPDTVTQIFEVAPFLANLELEDLTTAIETAWEMAEAGENARLRYHEETKLLFVRGSRAQVALVEQVLHQLRNRESPRRWRAVQEGENEGTPGQTENP